MVAVRVAVYCGQAPVGILTLNKSATQLILCGIIDNIQTGFNQHEHCRKAYNTVWASTLLYKLINPIFSYVYIHIQESFLTKKIFKNELSPFPGKSSLVCPKKWFFLHISHYRRKFTSTSHWCDHLCCTAHLLEYRRSLQVLQNKVARIAMDLTTPPK